MFVLIVGCGRVGSHVARRMMEDGHQVSVLDESPEAHALLDWALEDQEWEDLGGRFTVGTALEVEALEEAGIQQADVVVCSTDGDNTNIVVAQIARDRYQVPKVIARVLDPYRSEWYRERGLHIVCPTQVAIEMLTEAVRDSALKDISRDGRSAAGGGTGA